MSRYDEYLDYINKVDKSNIKVTIDDGMRYLVAQNYVLGYHEGISYAINKFKSNEHSVIESISSDKIFVTWEQVEEFVEYVATYVENNNKKISGVYGVPRGGLVFAVMLSHKLHVPMLASATNDCLIVDDICDSGESLVHFVKNTSNPGQPKPLIATMFYKENKLGVVPDFYKFVKTDQWIVFPFECDEERSKN